MTVNDISKLTGVSIRTLQYYDTIGLLKPNGHTEAGYRLYDDTALERLQQILLFKELEFSLKEIKSMINAPDFDRDKAKRAKEQWGQTPEYREYEEKTKDWTNQDQQDVMKNFMLIFAEFGKMRTEDPSSEKVQCEVEKLQNFISEHFYQCSDEILSGLGQMYASGGEFTQNIDKMGGEGTARFTADAIEVYCKM